jgi:capsid protein
MPRKQSDNPVTRFLDAKREYKADYDAEKASRFKRTRSGVPPTGSHADYHYRTDLGYMRIIEYAWDMYRNDPMIKPLIEASVRNTTQSGITPDPQTGDPKLNAEIKAWFTDWANDPEQCDVQGEMDLHGMENQSFRGQLVAGDHLVLPHKSGQIQLLEAQRLRTPTNTKRNVVQGVLLSNRRKRLEYWFTKEDVNPYQTIKRVSDIRPVKARKNGQKQVFHVYNPERSTQTRGISALTPIFNYAGMAEDINFAKLIQAQVISCITFIRNRPMGALPNAPSQIGSQSTVTQSDGSTRTLEEVSPGLNLISNDGEEITGFSPNVPNPEYFDQIQLILRMMGINLGLPLTIYLLDASDTNFSGWRGALDQAKIGFRENQRSLVRSFHRPIYKWRLRYMMSEDAAMRAVYDKIGDKIFRCNFNLPDWPYIQPLQDAQADIMRIKGLLTSPRRVAAENNCDWEDLVQETIEDNTLAIGAALKAADKLNKKFKPETPIHWREILSAPLPEGVKLNLGGGQDDAQLQSATQRTD